MKQAFAFATACLLGITVGSAAARGVPARVQATQELAVLLTAHGAHREPAAGSPQISSVPANRPITGEQTTLPVIGHSTGPGGTRWLQVMLPGRPDGSTGLIAQDGTRKLMAGWRILVDLAARRLRVYHDGRTVRTFQAVVGKPSTPTPTGQFFVEETVQMPVGHPGEQALGANAVERLDQRDPDAARRDHAARLRCRLRPTEPR
jgi:hypothetical protein